ncbi:hypothetical protein [Herbiconiux sp. YIM B11900]|uniref:hypothetical protein n=1 Tax=Herbiconiux sp. YIM B11900 TaxID=3404131 RepID=UPI003F879B9F
MSAVRRGRSGGSPSIAAVALPLALVLLGAGGCSAQAGPDAPSAAASASPAPRAPSASPAPVVIDGVGLSILQNRPDYGNRVLQLAVTNEGADPLTVTAARFASPQFESVADWNKPTEVPPGLVRQLPVQLGPAICPAPSTTPTLTVTVTDAAGASREITGRPSDPFGVLERIAGEDCLDDAVAAVATLTVHDDVEVTGSGAEAVAHLRLTVDPSRGRGSLRLTEAGSTILLEPADGSVWPLDASVQGGDAPRQFVLDAVPARCDPHAVAEDKRGTYLPVSVELGGSGPAGTIYLHSSDALRLALYSFIASTCGFAAG